jgi:hypothetical protein
MRFITFLDKLDEAKFKQPTIMYHGTSDSFLKSILSNGIVPTPKDKVWDTDPDAGTHTPSRVSLPGSYWTSSLLTASGSAGRARKKFGGNNVLVIAMLARQSAFADDSFNWGYAKALRNLGLSAELSPAMILSYIARDIDDKANTAEKLPEQFALEVHELLKSSDKQPIDAPLLKKAFWGYFKRLLAHAKKEGSFDTLYDLEPGFKNMVDNIPDVDAAESYWLSVRDVLTRRYTKTARGDDDINMTLRMTDPVGYSGGNKIVGLIGDNPNPTKEASYDEPKVLYYGDTLDSGIRMMITNYRNVIGPFPGMIDQHGNEVYPSDRD